MSYIGQQLPADVFSGFVTDSFTGDGSATTFTLSKAPFSEDALIVVINNVIQKPVTNFTVSGTTLTIVGTAVASSDVIYAMHTSGPVAITQASKVDVNGLSDGVILDADADTTISADTDDQIDFKAGGTDVMSMTATGLTINDGVEITTADNTDTLTLTSTDADASVGPALRLYRNSASPADDDELAKIRFDGKNSAGEDITYGFIQVQPSDVTDGTEDAFMQIAGFVGGSNTAKISMYSYATVFNEGSADIDFRVESNNNSDMFKIDAGAEAMLVGGMAHDDNARLCLQSQGNGYRPARFNNPGTSAANTYGLRIEHSGVSRDDNTSDFIVMSDSSGTNRCQILSDGDVKNHDNSYGALSDERIKSNIVDANSQWDDIKAIKVRNWKRKDDVRQYGDNAWVQIGVVAQELEAAGMDKLINQSDPTVGDIQSSSEFGTLNEDGTIKEIKEKVKGVKYSVLYMKAIKALQEAMAKIETLETKVKALEDA